MHVNLPSGATIELRDRVTRADRGVYMKAIEAAPEIEADVPVFERDARGDLMKNEKGDAVRVRDEHGNEVTERRMVIPSSVTLDNLDVLLARVITGWTVTDGAGVVLPVPAGDPTVFEELELEDYDALCEAVKPLLDKLFPSFKPTPDQDSPSGPSSV